MEELFRGFYEKYNWTKTTHVREFIHKIDWNDRLIGIKGSRGVGKTTLILQYIKKHFNAGKEVLYVSLDHLFFTENTLYELAGRFYRQGGVLLALDEVHKYAEWARELKNIYDDFPELKIVFTGSSLLHIRQAKVDLSRRAVIYEMPGLSFREFLLFETNVNYGEHTLEEILTNHIDISLNISSRVKPLQYFEEYLKFGYYPFFMENKKTFYHRLNEIILTILEIDIPVFSNISTHNIVYLKKLLRILSRSVPFKPNFSNLSSRTGISINTLKSYIQLLQDARLIKLLHVDEAGINSLNKPAKIYLDNPALMFALGDENLNIGNNRETFFLNQTAVNHKVLASENADFLINDTHFELGGPHKGKKQIRNLKSAYIVKDEIVVGHENTIPLWIFGFLY